MSSVCHLLGRLHGELVATCKDGQDFALCVSDCILFTHDCMHLLIPVLPLKMRLCYMYIYYLTARLSPAHLDKQKICQAVMCDSV